MEKMMAMEPTGEEAAKMQADIQQALDEIERRRERMERDQTDIEQSRARTRAMLSRLQAE